MPGEHPRQPQYGVPPPRQPQYGVPPPAAPAPAAPAGGPARNTDDRGRRAILALIRDDLNRLREPYNAWGPGSNQVIALQGALKELRALDNDAYKGIRNNRRGEGQSRGDLYRMFNLVRRAANLARGHDRKVRDPDKARATLSYPGAREKATADLQAIIGANPKLRAIWGSGGLQNVNDYYRPHVQNSRGSESPPPYSNVPGTYRSHPPVLQNFGHHAPVGLVVDRSGVAPAGQPGGSTQDRQSTTTNPRGPSPETRTGWSAQEFSRGPGSGQPERGSPVLEGREQLAFAASLPPVFNLRSHAARVTSFRDGGSPIRPGPYLPMGTPSRPRPSRSQSPPAQGASR
jgi:hypothetical protein